MQISLSQEQLLFLKNKALNIRIDSIRATTESKSGHPTSCLSAADIISVIFFHTLRYDYKNPKNPYNDRFIMSKGHAIPVMYAALKNLGVISDEELLSLRKFDSVLEGHPTPRFIYNEAATGSLGQGLSIGLGMALNAKHYKLDYKTYVMMGDGEIAEGSIWEAAELAALYKLDNLIGIVDVNRLAQSGSGIHDHDVKKYAHKFDAFGWKVFIVDGHNIEQILDTLTQAQAIKNQPTMLIAKTYKGYGVAHVQDKNSFHGKPFKQDELQNVINTLRQTFKEASEYTGDITFSPKTPEQTDNATHIKTSTGASVNTPDKHKTIAINLAQDPNSKLFDKDQAIATRKAYGYALAALGQASKDIFTLDADVKNSTFGEIFEKEFPERFVQSFIAEQNMIGITTGLESRGKVPFAATFAAFLTRAHDQIRMAGIGHNALRLCGSHAGVSIGQDGPSQMGLEDISMMRAIPNSIVLYPSDGISAYKLVEQMANYHDGISYLRTTRSNTQNLYDKNEEFPIGGCKTLRQSDNDKACIIAAGITLHEALKAYDILKAENISVSIIDLYSIKPLDAKTIRNIASKSSNTIITVEDHYLEGGLGETVASALVNDNFTITSLAVKEISRSGAPEKLLEYAGIDAQNIVKAVLANI